MPGVSNRWNHRPRRRPTPDVWANSDFAAGPPRVTRIFGSTNSIRRSTNGMQVGRFLRASGCGCRADARTRCWKSARLERSSPMDLPASCRAIFPDGPTKGRPWRSSSAPGPSPTKRIGALGLPSVKTRLVAVFFNAHSRQTIFQSPGAVHPPFPGRLRQMHGSRDRTVAVARRWRRCRTAAPARKLMLTPIDGGGNGGGKSRALPDSRPRRSPEGTGSSKRLTGWSPGDLIRRRLPPGTTSAASAPRLV